MQYAHIYNRGVEKRDIFTDQMDYLRFTNSLYIFNDIRQKEFRDAVIDEIGQPSTKVPLVEILAYCLMPNHFHLLIAYEDKEQLTRFMRKIGITYTRYFNLKYQRSGFLFQGKYKTKEINDEDSLIHVAAYIHANPLTAKIVSDPYAYRWSSLKGFIGPTKDPVITNNHMNHPEKSVYNEYMHSIADDQHLRKQLEDL